MNKVPTETKVIGGIGLLTVVFLVGGIFFLSKDKDTTSTSIPPSEVVAQNGLHWHPKLEIYIKDEKQEIPANIGLGAIHQEMHTHENAKDGVVHMEMNGMVTKDETRLENFFKIWGRKFSSTNIFDKVNGEEGKIKMTVNGKDNTDFENYLMRDGDTIEIRYE